MLGFVQVLESRRNDLAPAQVEQVFAAANRAGERLRALVDNMLNLTRLQQHKVNVPLSPVGIAAVIDDVVAVAPPPEGKHVEVQCPADLEATTNRDRLEQIVSNLLTNCYRYGGHNIVIRGAAENGRVRVEVADDGPGVEESLVAHLFEPFTRGATSSDVGGSGLGLAIAKRLATATGGDLRYEGDPATGARFVLEFEAAR